MTRGDITKWSFHQLLFLQFWFTKPSMELTTWLKSFYLMRYLVLFHHLHVLIMASITWENIACENMRLLEEAHSQLNDLYPALGNAKAELESAKAELEGVKKDHTILLNLFNRFAEVLLNAAKMYAASADPSDNLAQAAVAIAGATVESLRAIGEPALRYLLDLRYIAHKPFVVHQKQQQLLSQLAQPSSAKRALQVCCL